MKECQLMDNGDVFEIFQDGTIHKAGNIHKVITKTVYADDDTLKGWLWGVSVVCGIAIIALIIMLINVHNDLDEAQGQRRHYQDLYEEEQDVGRQASSKILTLKKFKKKVVGVYPIIISKIEIGNTYYDGTIETSYGSTLYSYNTMYLAPKIYYTGLTSGDKYLKIRWYRPSGELVTGGGSPTGYSQEKLYYLYEGENSLTLNGYGGSDRGHWSTGTYRIEIWYNDICLKSQTFNIF